MFIRLVPAPAEDEVLGQKHGYHRGGPVRDDGDEVLEVHEKVHRCLDADWDDTRRCVSIDREESCDGLWKEAAIIEP